MTHEMQPVRPAQGEPVELTAQGQTAYSRGRSNFMPDPGRGEEAGASGSPEPIVKTHRLGEAGRIEEASSRLARAKVEGEAPSIVLGPDGLPLNWSEWNTDSRRAWMEVQRDRAGEQLLDQQLGQRGDPHAISPAQRDALDKVYALAQDDPEAFGESYVRAIDTFSQKRAEPIVHGEALSLVKQALEKADIPESSKRRFLRGAEKALVLTPPETARSIRRIMKAIPNEPQRLATQAAKKAAREAAVAPAEPEVVEVEPVAIEIVSPEPTSGEPVVPAAAEPASEEPVIPETPAVPPAGAGGAGEPPEGRGRPPTAEGPGTPEPDRPAPLRPEPARGTTVELEEKRSAVEILGGVREDFGRAGFNNIAYSVQRDLRNNEISWVRIDKWREDAREIQRDPSFPESERADYERLDEALRLAQLAARRIERAQNPKLIELVSQHPRLFKHLDKINEFISKIKQGKYDERDEIELRAVIEAEQPPGRERVAYDPVTRRVSIRDIEPGDYLTSEQFDDFEEAKALMNGVIAEAVYQATREGRVPPRESRDLAAAMLDAGIRGNTQEAINKREAGYAAIEKVIEMAQPEDPSGEYAVIIEKAIEQIQATGTKTTEPELDSLGRPRLDSEGNPIMKENPYHGEYDHIIQFVLEYGLERIISSADKAPQEEYPQPSLYVSANIDRIVYMARQFDEDRERKYPIWNKNDAHDTDPTKPKYLRGYDPKTSNPDLFGYLVNLKSKRRTMHELFRGMKDPNTYLQYVTQLLRKTGFKFVEKDIVGVSDIQQIYEQVLSSRLSTKGRDLTKQEEVGWLTAKDFELADLEAAEMLRISAESAPDNYFKSMRKANNDIENRPLRKWEIGRAAMMGRSLSAASQRRIVFAILGDLPENPSLLYSSVESEYIARRLAVLKLSADRFFDQPLAKSLMRLIRREKRRKIDTDQLDHEKYGYLIRDRLGNKPKKIEVDKYGQPKKVKVDPEGYIVLDKHGNATVDEEHGKSPVRGLYGHTQGARDILDIMIQDPKSNGWRGWLLFLDQAEYQTETINGKSTTIGKYLEAMKKEYPSSKDEHNKKNWGNWNRAIAGRIKEQRLFLGILMRQGDLSDSNKIAIWENAARFLPSKIASLFPEETQHLVDSIGGDVSWLERTRADGTIDPGIRNKLWLAERLRVKNDAKVLSKQSAAKTPAEFAAAGDLRGLSYYFGILPERMRLTPNETRVVEMLQNLGRHEAGQIMLGVNGLPVKDKAGNIKLSKGGELVIGTDGNPLLNIPNALEISKIEQPFTEFLDDVPQTAWENNGDEDFNRILVSDQNDYSEGWGHVVGWIANPIMKIEDFTKVFIETFHKIQGPPGIEKAQKYIEAFIKAGLSQRRATALSKLFGSFWRDARRAGSEIEEFNLSAGIADNEEIERSATRTLAQADVISDNPQGEKDKKGRTQLIRILDEDDADRKAQWKGWLREFLQLLGPALFTQLFKQLDMKGLGVA